MADFVAVIRKAVDNLSDNTAENRTKVYGKARAAIRRQLESVNPRPSDEVIARQLGKLDQAIDEVESEHIEALPSDYDETDALMAELESMVEQSPVLAQSEPEMQPLPAQVVEPAAQPPLRTPRFDEAAISETTPSRAGEPAAPQTDFSARTHDEAFGLDETAPHQPTDRKSSRAGGVLALIVIFVLAAAGYAGWAYKDTFMAMFGTIQGDNAATVADVDEPATEIAAVPPETAETTAPSAPEPAEPDVVPGEGEKFTQRLNADGNETNPGPAPGPEPGDGIEGRSVAELSDAAPADEPTVDGATDDTAVASGETTEPVAQPLGVAQKMILYEERLGQQSLEVKTGTVVWTLVSEPSGDGQDQQFIRGEISNAEKGLSALLTIKQNSDPSLPASHIIEVVFALSTDFEGGSIDQLQRISFKQTEGDQGNPLIAVPAKITRDFYMVALNDLAEARELNTGLMRQRNWIDIPVVYNNGRQALITLEKGTSGTEVFNQALDAWANTAAQP